MGADVNGLDDALKRKILETPPSDDEHDEGPDLLDDPVGAYIAAKLELLRIERKSTAASPGRRTRLEAKAREASEQYRFDAKEAGTHVSLSHGSAATHRRQMRHSVSNAASSTQQSSRTG
jgi:hypothetical protein